jgi:hypothetical protein
MGGKVKGHRLLLSVTEQEHRLIARAAKAEGEALGLKMQVATYIRRAALLAAKAKLEP